MKHSFINLNQLRHFGKTVQDNPTHAEPIFIMTLDSSFDMKLKMEGTTIFVDTYTPTEIELNDCSKTI